MNTTGNKGRVVGALLLFQLAGMMAGFILLMPGVTPDYPNVAAAMASTIRLAVVVLFANGAIAVAISIIVYHVLRDVGPGWALWILALGIAWLLLQAVDNAHILGMLALSKQYVTSDGSTTDIYGVIAPQMRATRLYVHYTVLLTLDIWFAVFYAAMLRFRLVPRLLAGFALLTVALHIIGVPGAIFIGYPTMFPLAYGLMLSYLAVGGWLAFKGFARVRSQPA